jgi:outer membrane protein
MKRIALFLIAAASSAFGQGVLTLDDAKQEALRNHPAFVAAQLRSLLARQTAAESRASFLPSAAGYVDAVSTLWDNTRILAGGINNPSIYDRLAEGVVVTQTLTDFGRSTNRYQGAKSEVKAADEGAESSREQVILNVEANYLAALQAESVLTVSQQTLRARELLLEQVQQLEKNKLRSSLDVSFAKVAREQAQLLVQKAQGDVDGAMASLAAALGRQDTRAIALVDDPPTQEAVPAVEGLVSTALKQRPDLLTLRYQRDASMSYASAARDANYPVLSLAGYLGNTYAADSHLPSKYGAGGIQLTVPLFEGGATFARQHEAELRARIAEQALREAETNAVRDVRIAHAAALTAVQRLATTRQLLAHATEAYQLAQARYKAGSSSIVELTDAELNATTAAISLASAEFDARLRARILDFETGSLR